MKCRDAARLLVRSMFGGLPEADRRDLDEHLHACAACRRHAARYSLIRDEVAGMEPAALPAEAREVLMEGLRECLAKPEPASKPPADPRPETRTLHRVLFFVCGMLALGLLTVGLMMAFRGEMKPAPVAARVTYWAGKVQARAPGSGNWHDYFRGDAVLPGSALHTEPDGVLALSSDTAQWWMDGSTALALGEDGQAELALGRVCARCTASGQQPVKLMTQAGTVTCSEGEFVASLSGVRLTVACVAGAVTVGSDRLEAGQEGLVADGKLFGPVRSVRTAALTHWLLRFAPGGGEGLKPRRLASVPVAPERAALPDEVSIGDLSVELTARGPLVLVRLSGQLRNAGTQKRRVTLSAEGLLLPRPLAQTGPVAVDLPAGGAGGFQLSVVCVLSERAGRHVLGLNPAAWTASAIGHVALHLDARGEGGLREVTLPVQGFSQRRKDAVDWSWSAGQIPAGEPIVLEMELAKPGRTDALRLSTDQGDWALWAWRPDAADDAWVRKGRRVVLAFDATADFGLGGQAAAQEVMDVLLGAIPPAVPTALVAYDGALRVDRDRWAPNLPPRVDSLLASLWDLQGAGKGGHSAEFLAQAVGLAGGGQGEQVLIFVTGDGEPADAALLDTLQVPQGMHLLLVQVGAGRVARAYERLCARSGAVALALDPDEAPRLAGYDLLVALQSAPVRAACVRTPGGEVLSGAAGLANAPVVALVPLGGARSVLSAEVGGEPLEQRLEGAALPGRGGVTGAEAQALLRALRRAVH